MAYCTELNENTNLRARGKLQISIAFLRIAFFNQIMPKQFQIAMFTLICGIEYKPLVFSQ